MSEKKIYQTPIIEKVDLSAQTDTDSLIEESEYLEAYAPSLGDSDFD